MLSSSQSERPADAISNEESKRQTTAAWHQDQFSVWQDLWLLFAGSSCLTPARQTAA